MPATIEKAVLGRNELGLEQVRALLMGEVRERVRPQAEVQWRVPGDDPNTRNIIGYPAVFDQATTLYEGKSFIMQEKIQAGFFDDVLTDDMHLNYVHDSASAMARNGLKGPGGLELSVDAHGLRVYATVSNADLDVQRLAPKMDLGIVDQMSFAFTVADEKLEIFTDDQDREVYLYTLIKCRRLYDVCVCPLGAYSQTEAMLRSILSSQSEGRSDTHGDDEGLTASGSRSDTSGDDEGAAAGDGRSTEGHRESSFVFVARARLAKLTGKRGKLNA